MNYNKHKYIQHKQQKRRRQNNRGVKKQDGLYPMIDGNETHYPYAYCKTHKGYLTKGLAKVHNCKAKRCTGFRCLYQEVDL